MKLEYALNRLIKYMFQTHFNTTYYVSYSRNQKGFVFFHTPFGLYRAGCIPQSGVNLEQKNYLRLMMASFSSFNMQHGKLVPQPHPRGLHTSCPCHCWLSWQQGFLHFFTVGSGGVRLESFLDNSNEKDRVPLCLKQPCCQLYSNNSLILT